MKLDGVFAALKNIRINPDDLNTIKARAQQAINSSKNQVGAGSIPGQLVRTGTTWNPRGPNRGI